MLTVIVTLFFYCTHITPTNKFFPIFDISPGPYTDQSQGVGDSVAVPQEWLSLTDRIPDCPHHPDVWSSRDQPSVCCFCRLMRKIIQTCKSSKLSQSWKTSLCTSLMQSISSLNCKIENDRKKIRHSKQLSLIKRLENVRECFSDY